VKPRTEEQRAADSAEVEAFRAACDRFLEGFMEELIARTGLAPLAGSVHEHRSLLVNKENDTAMMLRVRFDFSDVLDQKELEVLIEAAKRAPGTIAES
jgi:hypothetical protein